MSNRTVAELAEILRAEGIAVVQHTSHDDDAPWSEVEFRGTLSDGMRAVELAQAHGYDPQDLVARWPIWGGDVLQPEWTLLFDNDRE